MVKHNVATFTANTWVTNPQFTASTTATWTPTMSTPDRVWTHWLGTSSTTTTANITWQQPVWDAWMHDDRIYWREQALTQLQADELQVRREQRSREQLAAEQQRQKDHATARSRAMDLLDGLLTEEERAVRDTEQRVALRVSDGHLYWLEMHRETVHGNIVRTDEHGCMLGRACVAPAMRDGHSMRALPTADGWVGQYLGLKFDAPRFLSHANWSGVRTCQVAQAAA